MKRMPLCDCFQALRNRYSCCATRMVAHCVWIAALLLVPPAVRAETETPAEQTTPVVDERCTAQASANACVDWTEGIVIALGTGAPASWAQNPAQKNISAMRAARLDAVRNMLELIRGVHLDANTTVDQHIVQNDQISTSIRGRLHGIRSLNAPRYLPDGSVQVRLEGRLHEILPTTLYSNDQSPNLPSPRSTPLALAKPGTVYTGLIVDARGTGVVPALAPKIIDAEGREVYSAAQVGREYALSQGIVSYAKSLAAARKLERVRGNPIVVKAHSTRGRSQVNLVISAEEAQQVRNLSTRQTFLLESRVVIVLD